METAQVEKLRRGSNQPFYQILVDVHADPNLLVAYGLHNGTTPFKKEDNNGGNKYVINHVVSLELQKGIETGSLVDSLLTGALKNLSSSTKGFWTATFQAGGENILVKLLTTG
ncbi:hypothetical protein ACFX1Z_018171 [Malus domestica]